MVPGQLSPDERLRLISLAREALEMGVRQKELPALDLTKESPCLQEAGATFVTLTRQGELRGCIGTLDAYQPLAEDVRQHAVDAALNDYRFDPVTEKELAEIRIEVSRLTPPRPLSYTSPDELLKLLHPHIDGVIIRDGYRRATFLPQVWEKVCDPADFLNHLCMKMGANPDVWRRKKLDVATYQVEEIHEGRE